jgi:2,3-bisphosphoglycerate-dependent phosphoglycerate mutase
LSFWQGVFVIEGEDKMKTIYLVRHCQATGQEKEAVLTAKGKEQAQKLAEFLKRENNISKIISSPYIRAIKTIEPYANEVQKAVISDERLGERILCNTPIDDWYEKLQLSFQDFSISLEGAESNDDAQKRGKACLEEYLRSTKNGEAVLFVTHGNLLTVLLHLFDQTIGFSDWKKLSNPDVYKVTLNPNFETSMIHRIWKEEIMEECK